MVGVARLACEVFAETIEATEGPHLHHIMEYRFGESEFPCKLTLNSQWH